MKNSKRRVRGNGEPSARNLVRYVRVYRSIVDFLYFRIWRVLTGLCGFESHLPKGSGGMVYAPNYTTTPSELAVNSLGIPNTRTANIEHPTGTTDQTSEDRLREVRLTTPRTPLASFNDSTPTKPSKTNLRSALPGLRILLDDRAFTSEEIAGSPPAPIPTKTLTDSHSQPQQGRRGLPGVARSPAK